MAGSSPEIFSRHEAGHLTIFGALDCGLDRVVVMNDFVPGLVVGSASPVIAPAAENGIVARVAGQVAEGLRFDQRNTAEGDIQIARTALREDVLRADAELASRVASHPYSEELVAEVSAIVDARLKAAWDQAEGILAKNRSFLEAASAHILGYIADHPSLDGTGAVLSGKTFVTGLGAVWELTTGTVLPDELKPRG